MPIVRQTMISLILTARKMIADPEGPNQQFSDQEIQDRLDDWRDDIRYEDLTIAPSIVNTPSTNNQPQTIFADYYSKYKWWELDAVLQGYDAGQPWIVLTPTTFEPITGHWTFEANVFAQGTVPGQLPPVFATGKIYDLNAACADLLEQWGASLGCAYDITVDGQTLRRSQMMQNKLTLAQVFRRQAKPKVAKMVREDVLAPLSSTRIRLLDSDDSTKGF